MATTTIETSFNAYKDQIESLNYAHYTIHYMDNVIILWILVEWRISLIFGICFMPNEIVLRSSKALPNLRLSKGNHSPFNSEKFSLEFTNTNWSIPFRCRWQQFKFHFRLNQQIVSPIVVSSKSFHFPHLFVSLCSG